MSSEGKGNTRREMLAAGAGAAAAMTIGFSRVAGAADEAGSITQLAKFKMNVEKEAEAIEALSVLTKAVEDNEPGVLAYIAYRSEKDPSEVTFYEVYKDDEALKAHGAMPHLAEMRKHFAAGIFQPPLEVIKLNRVSGYSR